MKYVDANILIRIITQDDPALAGRAEALLSSEKSASVAVLAAVVEEVIFVLAKYDKYLLSRDVIAEALALVFERRELVVSDDVKKAVVLFSSHKKLDFVDCLLVVKGKGKAINVLTFDTELQKVLK